ncbi:MAG: TonB-dependent receptor [Gemmatimonadetes bacterium]|nr:TonB-dependent receptor [Gemmatimonadota bacterium]
MDQVVKTVSKEILPYYFTDLVGKVDFPYKGGGDLSLTGYWGRDALALNLIKAEGDRPAVDLGFDWGNQLAGVHWRQPVGRGLLAQQLSVTEFFTRFNVKPDYLRFDNRARLWASQTTYHTPPVSGHRMALGVAAERYRIPYTLTNPGFAGVFAEEDRQGPIGGLYDRLYRPTLLAAFADDQVWLGHALLLRGGVRAEHVGQASFTKLAPRAALKLFLSSDHALTGSVGRYHQVIQSQRDQQAPLGIYEFWVGAGPTVPVAGSTQFVIGYEGWFGRGDQVSVEGYRKTFDHLITPNQAFSLRDSGSAFLPVEGNSWGVDVLFRRHVGKVRGWMAYSLVHATRRAEGIVFPPAHDRRHTINLVIEAPRPLHSVLGVRWGYGSPLPYTPLVGQWQHRNFSPTYEVFRGFHTEPLTGPLNSARFPPYSRLDLGLRWHGRKWGMAWEPYLQVVNAYNRRNVFAYFFDDSDPPRRTASFQLPVLVAGGVDFSW